MRSHVGEAKIPLCLPILFTLFFSIYCSWSFAFSSGLRHGKGLFKHSEHQYDIIRRSKIFHLRAEKNKKDESSTTNDFSDGWEYDGEYSYIFTKEDTGLALYNKTEPSDKTKKDEKVAKPSRQMKRMKTNKAPKPRSVTGMFGHTPPPMTDESWKSAVFEYKSLLDPLDLENKKIATDDVEVPKCPDQEWIQEALNLTSSSTWEQTRTAFRKEIRRLHPDTQGTLKLLGNEAAGTEESEAMYRKLVEQWKAVQYYRKKERLQKSSKSNFSLWTPKSEDANLSLDPKSMFEESADVGWLADEYSE